jgi:Domain of unknown function (DUF4129)
MSKPIPSTNFGWQWRQTQQRLGEWLELQLNQPTSPKPDNSAGAWSLQWLAPYITAVLLLVLLGLLVWLIVRGVIGWQQRRLKQSFEGAPLVADAPIVSQAEWLNRAKTYHSQGDFTQAGRSLYFALLQNLADRQVIPAQGSRTDQEYAAITREFGQPAAFATLLQTHEQIQFGGNALSAQDYERCQQAYGATDRAIAAAAAPATAKPAAKSSNRSGAA